MIRNLVAAALLITVAGAAQAQTTAGPGRAPSGVPVACSVTSVDGTTAQTVCPARPNRSSFSIANANAAGGIDLGCTVDGSTPTATHYTLKVYAGGFYEASWPAFVSTGDIKCIGLGGVVTLTAIQF